MRKNSSSIFWLILLAAVVALVFRSSLRREEAPLQAMPLPPLMAEGWINAAAAPAADQLRGKLVVLDAWATWCGPCVQELPSLIEFHRQAGNQVTLIGLTPESRSDADAVQQFVASREDMNWPIGYGAQPTFDALGTSAFPTYYLFGRDGVLLWQGHRVSALEQQVAKALAR